MLVKLVEKTSKKCEKIAGDSYTGVVSDILGGNTVTTSHKCCLLEIAKAPQKAFLKLVLKNKNDHPISKFIMQRVFRKCCLLELGKAPQKAIFKTCFEK